MHKNCSKYSLDCWFYPRSFAKLCDLKELAGMWLNFYLVMIRFTGACQLIRNFKDLNITLSASFRLLQKYRKTQDIPLLYELTVHVLHFSILIFFKKTRIKVIGIQLDKTFSFDFQTKGKTFGLFALNF